MSTPPTGRGVVGQRGRGRGRGSGLLHPQQPGMGEPGTGRGLPAAATVSPPEPGLQQYAPVAAAPPAATASAAGVTSQMAQLQMNPLRGIADRGGAARGGAGGRAVGIRREHENRIVTRPASCTNKEGQSGERVQLLANYIRIMAKPGFDWQLYQYEVVFQPDIESRRHKRAMLAEHRETLKDIAFDGTLLYSFQDQGQSKSFGSLHPETQQQVIITLTLIDKHEPESTPFYYLANLLLRKLIEFAGLKLIGRHYYYADKKINLERFGLMLIPGFMSNVDVHEGTLMINVDLNYKVVNKQTVYARLQQIFGQSQEYKRSQDTAIREFVGQIVMTTYNDKTYKIKEFQWEQDPNFTFAKRDGTMQSLLQYYQEKYHVTIADLTQPLIVAEMSKRDRKFAGPNQGPVLLIPELTCVTGISDSMRADFQLMKEMSSHTLVEPENRYNRIKEFASAIRENPQGQAELEKWKLVVEPDVLNVNAHILEVEQIQYSNRTVRYKPEEADWGRDGRALLHISAKNLRKWVVLCTQKDAQQAEEFVNALNQVCRPFGMDVQYPDVVTLPNDRPETYLNALESKLSPDLDLVLCMLSNNRKDRYDLLKQCLCLQNAIPSQMILAKTCAKKGQLMSVATKVGIQINAKLGGEIWAVQIPSKTLMIVGIDSYADKKSRAEKIDAFVASTNAACTRFYSRIIKQKNTQEMIEGLRECFTGALQEFQKSTGALPEKIVIYRDGLVEWQFKEFVEVELYEMLGLFPAIVSGWMPKVGVVVVQKQTTARFFARTPQGRLRNPTPGSIVDNTVTDVEYYDFYLISQVARQGTVAPTRFNVVYDDTALKVDHMQKLTWKLCHMYYNWPGTIRVPAVCQYAHKLAFLTAQSLHEQFNPALSDKLFYL